MCNTCTVYSPAGPDVFLLLYPKADKNGIAGELTALHKVHLFDVDIPGKIIFVVCSIS
jgi:hypothetical protein